MDRQRHIRQQLELLFSPTSVQYHRIDNYSSIVEGVRRVRRILLGGYQTEDDRLIQACSRNDIDTVKWLLDHAEINTIDFKKGVNRSALHEAALHRDGQSLVRLLCQCGADPKQRDSLGRTSIHYAASCGHLDIMIHLIQFSRVAVSTLVDMEGRCPLIYACGQGHLSLCQWLVEEGHADYHRRDDQGRSCIIYACQNGHVEVVEWLLSILSPESTNTGWHPLHLVCSLGHLDILKVLLRHNKSTAQVLTNTGHSALYMAMHSTRNNIEMMKCLLDSHPSVQLTLQDIQDLNCEKPLILLLAQRRHSLDYLLNIIERIDYPLPLIRLLLLSEHTYCSQKLLSIPYHQSFISDHLRNPLKLKQIIRRLIRKSIDTSNKIDQLEIHQSLKSFIRFEWFY